MATLPMLLLLVSSGGPAAEGPALPRRASTAISAAEATAAWPVEVVTNAPRLLLDAQRSGPTGRERLQIRYDGLRTRTRCAGPPSVACGLVIDTLPGDQLAVWQVLLHDAGRGY